MASILTNYCNTAHLGLNGDEAADGEEEQWSDHGDCLPGSEELWMAALVIMCHRKAPGWWLGYHGGVLARWIYGQHLVNIKDYHTKQGEHNTNHLKQAPSSIGLSLKI